MKKHQLLLKKMRTGVALLSLVSATLPVFASSHREAPLISADPLADNTDLYAFRSPDDTNTVTIIANFIPFELPEGGPNYNNFSPDVRYEIHIKNKTTTLVDDVTYRFTFTRVNEDTSTFFNIRLGKQNLKTVYKLEKSINNSTTLTTIVATGIVPPNNIGARSIEATPVGLNANYNTLQTNAIATATTGEKVFCGPVDDPFFADLAGIFDLGNVRPAGIAANATKDGLARYNVHTIAIKIPITLLHKTGAAVTTATSILDPNFVIGVWASASRLAINTLSTTANPVASGTYVQVSRLGMPLTNEAIIPLGAKDRWNATVPYNNDTNYYAYFRNPELALYMDTARFASAVPALSPLRIQMKSLGLYDFRNGKKGLFSLKGTTALAGTVLDTGTANYARLLLPDSTSPRAIDLLPIFNTGVPNARPYQLATGKNGNPLAAGKPFINNFFPVQGDMLRLNMAVPVTPRNSPAFSSLGLIQAAVLGLTDANYNTNTNLQFIPNMDGFPNGRRLEDDVTTIELQAVSGAVLAAIGLWYDDYIPGTSTSPVTPALTSVLSFTAGPTSNDTTFKTAFPYVQAPWRGSNYTAKDRF